MPPRRAAAAICLMAGLALPALLPAALPQPAAASVASAASPAAPGHAKTPVTVAITGLSQGYARPGQRITVRGLVTSNSPAPLRGVTIQLMSSGQPFTVRDELQPYEAGRVPAPSLIPVRRAVARIHGVLRRGATMQWRAVLPVNAVHMTQFGVYPLAAQVTDQTGAIQGTDYTFLPFWPSARSKLRPHRDDIAWLWPLIDMPAQGPCPGLLNNHLAASLSGSGRLGRLLDAGTSAAGRTAQLTWVLDPALLSSAQTIAGGRQGKARYTTGAGGGCQQGTSHPPSPAARTWLNQLRSAVHSQPAFVTPYADVDITALTRASLDNDLHRAFHLGRDVASDVLGRSFAPKTGPGNPTASALLSAAAWPADGLVSYSMLPNLAAVDGIRMVVLSSAAMPPADPQLSYTPSAVTHTLNGVGGETRILLADATLTQVLGRANARVSTPATAFATSQRFLAETAMIAAQSPHLSRAIVVAPPRRWNPRAGLASSLLGATDTAPWLSPISTGKLAAERHAPGQVQRRSPRNAGQHKFSRSLVQAIKAADRGVALVQSLRVQPNEQLYWAVAGVESSAWRGRRAPHRPARAVLHRITAYVAHQESSVSIIGQGRTTLGGQKGGVPVTVDNRLGYTVRVRIRLHVNQTVGGGFSVLPSSSVRKVDDDTVVTDVIQVGAHSPATTKIQVRAGSVGSTSITMRLLTPNGQPLPGRVATMTVQATHFGTFALVILAAALAVFMITSAGRAIRRGRSPATGPDDEQAPPDGDGGGVAADDNGQTSADAPARSGGTTRDQPDTTDNVVHDRARSAAAGTDHDLTEDADDYARVPGWADRS